MMRLEYATCSEVIALQFELAECDDWDEIACCWIDAFIQALWNHDLDAEPARSPRTLLHGWNGDQFGQCVGTAAKVFGDAEAAQIELIWQCSGIADAAVAALIAQWRQDDARFTAELIDAETDF